ncbi:MAG TPA: BTAD domain-containing putative transcriptional regulator [Anaerolineae bacterium]|nr:BTAD domain-containing putative transcriptional regulator [Anaerolineae bacterium]
MRAEEAELQLKFLGAPEIWYRGELVEFASAKATALLAILAVTGERQTRDSLVALLWPESDRKHGRGALRYTLSVLKKGVGDEVLEIRRQDVGLVAERVWVDLTVWQEMLLCAGHERGRVCASCYERKEAGVEIYRDHFLAGFSLRDAITFDEWAFLESEQYRQQFSQLIGSLVVYERGQGHLGRAIAHSHQWVKHDPLQEEAHKQLIQLYMESGQPDYGRRQFEIYARYWEEELGLSVGDDVAALLDGEVGGGGVEGERLLVAAASLVVDEAVKTAVTTPTVHLPEYPTEFVGRVAEREQIGTWLQADNIRIVTIVGPGGMGKSRLAVTVGQEMGEYFRDGVAFVPLAPLSERVNLETTMAVAMATAINFSFYQGGGSPQKQLFAHLATGRWLLILDNLEHLLGEALTHFLQRLLSEAPGVKLLLTSRERVHLQAERLLPLAGLGATGETTAVQLFMARCRRQEPNWEPTLSEREQIAALCGLVGGHPLALELAAALVGRIPLADLVTAIGADMDVLHSRWADLPERHRSLRAVFASSWARLTVEEQRVLACLSYFRGGVTAEAAEVVVGTTVRTLAGLVERSLVGVGRNGRYDLHELMRQYAAEELGAEATEALATAHAEYYQHWLTGCQQVWATGGRGELLVEIEAEIDNVRRAWRWGMAEGDVSFLTTLLLTSWFFWRARARLDEGVIWIQQLVREFEREATALQLISWYRLWGEAAFGVGDLVGGRQMLERALQVTPDKPAESWWGIGRQMMGHWWRRWRGRSPLLVTGNREVVDPIKAATAHVYNYLAFLYYTSNELGPLLSACFHTVNLAETARSGRDLAYSYAYLYGIYRLLGWRRAAEQYRAAAETWARESHDRQAQIWVGMAVTSWQLGERPWGELRVKLEETLVLSQQMGERRRTGDIYVPLSYVHYCAGDYERGAELCQELYEWGVQGHNLEHQVWGQVGRSLHLVRLGRIDEAKRLLVEVAGYEPGVGQALLSYVSYEACVARCALAEGDYEGALLLAEKIERRLAEGWPVSFALFDGCVVVPWVALWVWASEPALAERCQRLVKRGRRHLRSFARVHRMGRPWLYLCDGWWWQLRGRGGKAGRAWGEGRRVAEGLAMPYEVALADYLLGRYGEGEAGRALLLVARAGMAGLGARGMVAEVDRVIGDRGI